MAVAGGHASGTAVNTVVLTFTSLAVIASVLRLYTRIGVGRNGGYDDACIVVATVLTIALTVTVCLETKYGNGRHQSTISPEDGVRSLQALYASIIVYNLALFFCKCSILLQYLRIFPQRHFRFACFSLLALIIVYANWTLWSQVFFCKPIAAYWDLAGGGKCLDRGTVWFVNAGMNIVSDMAVAVLPLPMLRQLNIQRKPKIALMIVFALGGFTCIVSILRLASIYALTHSVDTSYNGALAALWSSLEVNTGILCSSLPTLKTLVSRAFPHLFTSYHRSHPSGALDPKATFGSQGKKGMTHDQISRGFSGRGPGIRGQHAAFASRGSQTGSMKIDLAEMMGSPSKEIKVLTVVNQEVEGGLGDERRKSEQGSTRDLIYRTSLDSM
ncbi:hypothetical protein LTR56_010079 [Elasticomyces elasticus]|nr:hypothetical protein LTR56_010079 [Elasticomyces elasticus]KAK3658930.1 hypothetical protein LTR22_008755 [Elasticomyces elasticus]KAK4923072.1 hypothetical protein LTR49_009734 [Elasticomyces elasticus]KAK5741572.1 hypothetical protein LTS12_024536 [Elasticomyces elasticus]